MVPDQLPRLEHFYGGNVLESGKRFVSSNGSTITRADCTGRHGTNRYGMRYLNSGEVPLGDVLSMMTC